MKNLHGVNALLTGGSRGIGPYIAHTLAREGVRLALAARSSEQLRAVAKELSAVGGKAIAIPTDISDPAARLELVSRAEAELGPIDILVNNASIAEAIPFAKQAPLAISRIVETNLVATLQLTRLVVPQMLKRGSGHIVTISSLNGKKGVAYYAAHSATKAALIEWTNALRGELDGSGVSASVVCLGLVSRAGWWAEHRLPVPRCLGESTPQQVAQAVVRAIKHDLHEVIVNPVPVRPALALNALSPALLNALLDHLGLVEFLRRTAIGGET
jgi:short-subunit dehydrogenase